MVVAVASCARSWISRRWRRRDLGEKLAVVMMSVGTTVNGCVISCC